jgi:hypothetical protein
VHCFQQISQDEISDYCRTFEGKIASFLQPVAKISDEEYSKLGHKDPDAYPFQRPSIPLLKTVVNDLGLKSVKIFIPIFSGGNTLVCGGGDEAGKMCSV